MSTNVINFREPFSMIFSASAYLYEELTRYRDGIEINMHGDLTQKSDYKLSTGRIIEVEFAFIPLILLASIEMAVRSVLYLIATPFLMVCFAVNGEPMMKGVMLPLLLEGLQLSVLTASVKGMYRNIFSEMLPYIGTDDDVNKFISDELPCGFASVCVDKK